MDNRLFGSLADVFKHLALCEVLSAMRPGEYWESHAGAATYAETGAIPPQRSHGVHFFAGQVATTEALRLSTYGKIIATAWNKPPVQIPGSSLLARIILGENIRRYLLCDTDADALQNVQQTLLKKDPPLMREMLQDKLECVDDDGISVLRGAGVLLPEKWTTSTLAFIDPEDIFAPTDAGISPLELACELANRSVPVLLFYTFKDADTRAVQHRQLYAGIEKARLSGKVVFFVGSLKAAPVSPALTQWGFGMLALCLRPDASEAADQKLRALAAAYEKAPLTSDTAGAWNYTRTTR